MKKYKTLGKYILKGKKIVECADLFEWAEWFEESKNRIIKQETLNNGLEVSTIFLGLNHNFSGKGKPVLFETMVFEPLKKGEEFRNGLYQERCSTRKKAKEMHKRIFEKFKNYKKNK